MRQVLIISMVVLMYHHAFSQKENYNWVFGDSAGLNFSSSVPEYFSSSIWSAEACSSISDSAGNLLFYTMDKRFGIDSMKSCQTEMISTLDLWFWILAAV
ncbi:MAG: hypothetical protein IPN31_05070 [Bacteroidetes bacterium]|nr:hypothetical protein [Bacteroidota bacterium]